jgi:hypothetical protein
MRRREGMEIFHVLPYIMHHQQHRRRASFILSLKTEVKRKETDCCFITIFPLFLRSLAQRLDA